MNRIEKISADNLFRQRIKEIEDMEQARIFCRHGLNHLLDVARIAWIDALENGLPLQKDIVYAAALLHDIGRATDNKNHHTAGQNDISEIMGRAGYCSEEIEAVLAAVADHRTKAADDPLSDVLYRADKRSRMCFACAASAECHWPEDRKNRTITV